jgi:hypothetical protein
MEFKSYAQLIKMLKHCSCLDWAAVALVMATLIAWPDPLFAFSLGFGKIVVASDRPIDATGGDISAQTTTQLISCGEMQ